ncbi:MAG: glycosyltransferase family 2 protein [Flavobacteriales bacterium]
MPKISAIVLTLNEERNIGRCLESLSGIVDEIIVVDSFSTDRTEEIAKSHGSTFIQQKFLGYIEQKNFALTKATYDHVLSLDADEALSDELRLSILEVKESFDCEGYFVNRLANYCGQWIRHGGWYPDWKMRLFDRTKGTWRGTNPHDKYVLNKGSKSRKLKGDLHHYTFYTAEEHRKQVVNFTNISSQAKYDQGVRSNWMKICVKPMARFVKGYIFKLGFLDGYFGLRIALYSTYATYLKYRKLLSIQQAK